VGSFAAPRARLGRAAALLIIYYDGPESTPVAPSYVLT